MIEQLKFQLYSDKVEYKAFVYMQNFFQNKLDLPAIQNYCFRRVLK